MFIFPKMAVFKKKNIYQEHLFKYILSVGTKIPQVS